jgi:hypothetical protein
MRQTSLQSSVGRLFQTRPDVNADPRARRSHGDTDVAGHDHRALTGREPAPIRAIPEEARDRLPLSLGAG